MTLSDVKGREARRLEEIGRGRETGDVRKETEVTGTENGTVAMIAARKKRKTRRGIAEAMMIVGSGTETEIGTATGGETEVEVVFLLKKNTNLTVIFSSTEAKMA